MRSCSCDPNADRISENIAVAMRAPVLIHPIISGVSPRTYRGVDELGHIIIDALKAAASSSLLSPELASVALGLQNSSRNILSSSVIGSEMPTACAAAQLQRHGVALFLHRMLLRPAWFSRFLPLLGAHDPLSDEERRALAKAAKSVPYISRLPGAKLFNGFAAVTKARMRSLSAELETCRTPWSVLELEHERDALANFIEDMVTGSCLYDAVQCNIFSCRIIAPQYAEICRTC